MSDETPAKVVKPLPKGDGKTRARTGKPRKVPRKAMISRTAAFGGAGAMGNAGSVQGVGGNFYSPELSTDFLELPQSLHEQWNYYRFFYRSEPFVGQAIDLHTELPLSKIRIGVPKCKNRDVALAANRFCEKWAKRIGLLHRLISIVHERNIIGEVFIWCEDANPEMPKTVRGYAVNTVDAEGKLSEQWVDHDNADEREFQWLKKNYKGWTSVRVLPPEQIRMESFNFTDERLIELIPDSKTKDIIERARAGDAGATRIVESMPLEIVKAVIAGNYIPLNTDPYAGSFVHYLANRKSDYEPRGRSLLERCFVPETPITVLRGGFVNQVPAEDVNPDTDLLLTHTGLFRKAQKARRHVDEQIVEIHIEGLPPIRVTAEHRVITVQPDGSDSWVHAEDLKPGDVVREGHVLPECNPPESIDLAAWWRDRTFRVRRRVRCAGGSEDREVRVLAAGTNSAGGLDVVFGHDQDNANRVDAVARTGVLLDWAKGLAKPTVMSINAVQKATGLAYNEVRNCSAVLRAQGLLHTETFSRGRGAGRATTWFPAQPDSVAPGASIERRATSSVTHLPMTPDFLYLLGTWLGDGCVWQSDEYLGVSHVEWSVSLADDALRDHVVKIARQVFGADAVKVGNLIPSRDATVLNVRVEDMLLARWFHDEFGVSAQTKQLPLWVFQLPEESILALLRGILDTDGCLRLRSQAMIEVVLDNENLTRQLHLLCNRVGIRTQVYQQRRKIRSWHRTWDTASGPVSKTYQYAPKTYWKLGASRYADVYRWAHTGSIKGARHEWRTPRDASSKWVCRKVLKTERVAYTGDVISFGVEQFETLVAGGIAVHNCLRTLTHRDKLRQAQASIASRHMTPIRIVYGEDMDAGDVEALREQVDMSLQDPDYSIIANFQINWEEMGADQRLLDLNTEYDMTDRQLYAGLGVTEGLLSGESAYSGDRINLEVINTRYMLLREQIQTLVEDAFFRPMCARMGFVDTDDDGEEYVVVPPLNFTRLALRDNRDTFDALYNLYTKGSLDVETILELLNLDPITVREKLEKDLFTVNDPTFNEVLRGIYGEVGRALAEKSDAVEIIADNLKLKYAPPKEEGDGRF